MQEQKSNLAIILNKVSKTFWMIVFTFVLLAILAGAALVYVNHGNRIGLAHNTDIAPTPTQIRSIRDIGQWEFLSVSDEELIDTIRHGFFGDSELVRIYYGTLHIGVDLNDAADDWIKPKGDSIVVNMPPIKLLDHNFIDEARTLSFYESGKWTAQDREALYQRAYRAMLNRCMTTENISSAEQNAGKQMHQLMKSLGYENVSIRFDRTNTKEKK